MLVVWFRVTWDPLYFKLVATVMSPLVSAHTLDLGISVWQGVF